MRTGPSNIHKKETIAMLNETGHKAKEPIWLRTAFELSRARRHEREVNVSQLNRYANENDMILVPGKVLGAGFITKKITVSAWSFSKQAIIKLQKAGCKIIGIQELVQKGAKGKKIRIMG